MKKTYEPGAAFRCHICKHTLTVDEDMRVPDHDRVIISYDFAGNATQTYVVCPTSGLTMRGGYEEITSG
jgi:hypothetical protein